MNFFKFILLIRGISIRALIFSTRLYKLRQNSRNSQTIVRILPFRDKQQSGHTEEPRLQGPHTRPTRQLRSKVGLRISSDSKCEFSSAQRPATWTPGDVRNPSPRSLGLCAVRHAGASAVPREDLAPQSLLSREPFLQPQTPSHPFSRRRPADPYSPVLDSDAASHEPPRQAVHVRGDPKTPRVYL